MDREERLAKNRAVLAALSIPSLAAETREAADETADGSRRRGRAGASASTAPSRRSSRAEARKVKSYADAPGEDSGDRASDESDAGSDSARARAEEAADADFSGSESESESGSETGGSEDEDENEEDARVVRARVETPEIVELDEDGEEVGGDAKGRGRKRQKTMRARGAFASNVSRDASNDDDASRPSRRPRACPGGNPARKGRARSERDARDGETKPKPKPKPKPKRGERRDEDEDQDEDEDKKKNAARDAFLAFLAPSASVAVRRGFLNLRDATFGLRELRAVVNAHGFEDWTDEELAQMLAPELVKPRGVQTENASGESERADAAAAETDPSAADARRRAVAAAAAAEMRLGVSDLERLAETVGARRRAT